MRCGNEGCVSIILQKARARNEMSSRPPLPFLVHSMLHITHALDIWSATEG